ncbi:MAG: S8 family serine peptidase [Candidatus Sumerlaeia bacterium]|nr:S8 family serine peptidase [Candidatus Sumerlaeia bacterium]
MRNRRLSLAVCGAVAGMIAVAPWSASVHAQEAAPSKAAALAALPQRPAEPIHFYRGGARVDMVVALDELHVRSLADKAALGLDAETPLATRMHLDGVESSDRLFEEATAMRAGGDVEVSALLYPSARIDDERAATIVTREFVVKLLPGVDAAEVAKLTGATVNAAETAKLAEISDRLVVFSVERGDLLGSIRASVLLGETAKELVEYAEPSLAEPRAKNAVPNDPLYRFQYHLKNTGQVPFGRARHDVNAEPAWDIVRGQTVNIAINDDGLQEDHPDLAPNVRADLSIDLNFEDDDPTPGVFSTDDGHGTACAGVAAARGFNGVGVTGAAPEASLVGQRFLSIYDDSPVTDTGVAFMLSRNSTESNPANQIHVNSNSWGPIFFLGRIVGLSSLDRDAMTAGVTNGRNGRGIVYVYAAGNSACEAVDTNAAGRNASRFGISVGALGANGTRSYYSQAGESLWVVAPSNYGFSCPFNTVAGIATTDLTPVLFEGEVVERGYLAGNYTDNSAEAGFGGTSSACPLISGVCALILEANPDLGWRDVKWILAETSRRVDGRNKGWRRNTAGFWYNREYGFGLPDAHAAVEKALTWTNLPPEATPLEASETVGVRVPDRDPRGVIRSLSVDASGDFITEAVEFTVKATHATRGDFYIVVQSPTGTLSEIARPRREDANANYDNYTFTTARFLGERANGTWRMYIGDRIGGDVGTWDSWSMKVHGHLRAE